MSSLAAIESSLNSWLQPSHLGEKWDNIGLLVGSGKYSKEEKIVNRILLCNDLTKRVLDEAIEEKTDLIIAYHPPIFSPMKAIAYGTWKEQIIARALAHDISIYSPHTTLDTAICGINDHFIKGYEKFGISKVEPITPLFPGTKEIPGWLFRQPNEDLATIFNKISSGFGSEINLIKFSFDFSKEDNPIMGVYFSPQMDPDRIEQLRKYVTSLPKDKLNWSEDKKAIGSGRIVHFEKPVNAMDIIKATKKHLNINYLQYALAEKEDIKSLALCVGSGASLLRGVPVDMYVSGEMSHHEILECVENNRSLILCGHCNSERHFLPTLASTLKILTSVKEILISKEDGAPLKVSLS